jgi:thiol-activated cytolysin
VNFVKEKIYYPERIGAKKYFSPDNPSFCAYSDRKPLFNLQQPVIIMEKSIKPTKPIAGVPVVVCGFVIVALLIFASCSDNGISTGPDAELTFESVIKAGGTFEPVPETRSVDTLSVKDPESDDRDTEDGGSPITERWICTTSTVSVLDGNGQFPLFNTNADVIYPGNLLQGKSLSNATSSPIVVERAGGTISYDLNNGNLSSTFTVDRVSKSSIQNAMNNIIANAGDVVPANFRLEIQEVQSENQLALELGLNMNTYSTKVKSSMSFSSERSYNRFLVKLTQSYYTMSFDLPTRLDQLFDPSVTPEELTKYVQADNPATFISSVTYGRIFYMLVESTSSTKEMAAKLDASYGAFRNSVDGSVDVSSFQEMNNVKIKVIAYGGDAAGTFELAGEATITNIANKLAESTDIRAGLPLSYVVRSVERPDQIVGTKIATEYDVTNCELKGILPPQGYRELVDHFEDGIGAMIHIANSNVIMYNKAGTQYAWYNGNSGSVLGTFDIHDPDGPMGVSTFSGIGAGVRFTDNRLYIFDLDGLRVEFMSYNSSDFTGNTLPSEPIATYDQSDGANRVELVNEIFGDSGNFQFANRGFGAATRVGATTMAYFTKEGDQYALYDRTGNGTWQNPLNSNTWFNNNANEGGQKLFDRAGAATHINFGGSSGRWLIVNEAGDELIEYYSLPVRKFEGPWVIK